MAQEDELSKIAQKHVEISYPELRYSQVHASYGRTSAFASVTWEPRLESVTALCNPAVKEWHDAAITGLLAHEFSHPAQPGDGGSEEETDLDVIGRGLGIYLAVERILAGKYEDHHIRRGRDRYLGYRTIRRHLFSVETAQLDGLLREMKLIPTRYRGTWLAAHDVTRIDRRNKSYLTIDGAEIVVKRLSPSSVIDVLLKDGGRVVLIDNVECARLPD
jgi:DNA-binding transcriptional ArsR family regulator